MSPNASKNLIQKLNCRLHCIVFWKKQSEKPNFKFHISVNRTNLVCRKSLLKIEIIFCCLAFPKKNSKYDRQKQNTETYQKILLSRFLGFFFRSYGSHRLSITFSKNMKKVEGRFQALEEETRIFKPLLESLDVIEPKNVVSSVREVAFKDLAFVTAATRDHFEEAYRCVF